METELTRPAIRVAEILEAVLHGETPRVAYLQSICEAHGWPDRDEMTWQAAALRRLDKLEVTFEIDAYPKRRRRSA